MACEYCRQFSHDYRCSLAPEPKFSHYCSICGAGIYDGEEYIENDDGEVAHWECVDYARDLVSFLGYDVKVMESEDENY